MTDTTGPKRVLTLHMELSGSYDLERMFRVLLKDSPETADVLLSMSDKELEWALTEKEHSQIPFEILVAASKHMRIQIDVETEPYADELLECTEHPGHENHCRSGMCGECWLCKERGSNAV